jgi:hypothetical protein
MGFIAEDSKNLFSDSPEYFSSQGLSRISSIKSDHNGSPHYLSLDLDISGLSQMDSWSQNSSFSMPILNFKRSKP